MTGNILLDGATAWSIGSAQGGALVLDRQERAQLAAAAESVADRHRRRTQRLHLDSVELMADCGLTMHREGPERLVRALWDFRYLDRPDAILLVRNLPVDETLPPTPSRRLTQVCWDSLPIASVVQLMVMNVLGEVISYADEKQGEIIQDVVPVPGAEHRQENSGSCLLELHTEDGFHPQRPRYISLLGLRPDHQRRAWTVASSIRAATAMLSGGVRAALARPVYRIRFASSFVGGDDDVCSTLLPVLRGSARDPQLCVDFHAMVTDDEEAAYALATLRHALLSNLRGHVLDRGDLLVVDNDYAVHGRTSFQDPYDGTGRWLRRCFAVADRRRSVQGLLPDSLVHARLLPDREHSQVSWAETSVTSHLLERAASA